MAKGFDEKNKETFNKNARGADEFTRDLIGKLRELDE